MKTIELINSEITTIQELYKDKRSFKKSELNKAGKKVRLLTLCKYYLETNPTNKFVVDSRDSIKNKLKIIKDRFSDYIEDKEGKTLKQLEKEWNALNKTRDLKYQLSVLNYLIN